MEGNLDKEVGEYRLCSTDKKQKAPEEWKDKDMKEFYIVRIGGD